MRAAFILLLALILIAPVAAEIVVINSVDWRDVYSGAQYAATLDEKTFFVVDTTQGADLAQRLGADTNVLLISGKQQAMPGFKSLIQSRGYVVEEIRSADALRTNQDLALRSTSKNLIIVDDAYGYNAVSVATYAKLRGSSVLFADQDVLSVIDEKQPDELLLYGHIPSVLYELLQEYDPVIINTQDRFDDNFELVTRYNSREQKESLILSNGEFIETQLVTGDAPLLFIGRQNVPDNVVDFISDNSFRSAVLVGNALAPNAKYIKDETGIGVFIKFAQGRNERQYALDLFPLPIPNPLVTIQAAEYDATSQTLLVTYTNPGDVVVYFSASFQAPEGTIEDSTPVFLESGTYKTVRYPVTDPGTDLPYTIIFGAAPNSLELLLDGTLSVSSVTIDDHSVVTILDVMYDPGKEAFFVQLENPVSVDAYVLVELTDVRVGGENLRLAGDILHLRPGQKGTVEIPASLTERDIDRNSEISIEVLHGEREFSLVKSIRETRPFVVSSSGYPWWLYVAVVVVAIIALWFILKRRRR